MNRRQMLKTVAAGVITLPAIWLSPAPDSHSRVPKVVAVHGNEPRFVNILQEDLAKPHNMLMITSDKASEILDAKDQAEILGKDVCVVVSSNKLDVLRPLFDSVYSIMVS